MKKLLVIKNIPTPYHIPLFNELNRQLEDRGLKLKVLFGALGYRRRKWEIDMSQCKFDYIVLPSKHLHYLNPEKVSFTYPGLYRIISEENPSVIITNGFSIATMKLWLRSLFLPIPYLIWSEAVQLKNKRVSFLRRIQRKILVNKASGFIAPGTKAKKYLTSLGAKQDKVTIAISTVDTKFFIEETKRIRNNLRLGNEKKRLLYIGDLIKRKRVDRLFRVIKVLLRWRQDFVLEVVGGGPEMGNLRRLSEILKIIEFVRFEGFKQKEEIPQYLARADCFLFPSGYDEWGLVLVEAMATELPCISSIQAGATYDLIEEGVTGFAMDFSETEKVVERINWILNNPKQSKEIGRNASLFIAENVNLQKSVVGFVKAITRTLEEPALS